MNSLWSHNFQENKNILLPFKLLYVTQSKLHTNKKFLSLCNLLHAPCLENLACGSNYFPFEI